MSLPERMSFGIFLAPFHWVEENPTLGLERDLELLQWLDKLTFDEAWIGEHHSAGWETISSPELFIATAAERTKHIKFGTGVLSIPYHHPLMVANRMIQLDHITRGRVMLGVGPGALTTDAHMLGIEHTTQRERLDEGLGIIKRLLIEDDPITYKSDWFNLNDARVHLKPFTKPHFPIYVAAAQSPTGMRLAGKYGAGVLSISVLQDAYSNTLKEFWNIAEDVASENNQKVSRDNWRLVMPVHLAETKKEAIEQSREGAAKYQRDYFENTMGFTAGRNKLGETVQGPREKIVEEMNDSGMWCIGTPDDLVETILRLDEQSGGFGGVMIQATEFGNREQILRSYELIARYVMPKFQGTTASLIASQQWAADNRFKLMEARKKSIDKAANQYTKERKEKGR